MVASYLLSNSNFVTVIINKNLTLPLTGNSQRGTLWKWIAV
jgi:hypothetical protein